MRFAIASLRQCIAKLAVVLGKSRRALMPAEWRAGFLTGFGVGAGAGLPMRVKAGWETGAPVLALPTRRQLVDAPSLRRLPNCRRSFFAGLRPSPIKPNLDQSGSIPMNPTPFLVPLNQSQSNHDNKTHTEHPYPRSVNQAAARQMQFPDAISKAHERSGVSAERRNYCA